MFYFVNIIADCSNCSSNFRLIKDTYLIYRTPLRFATASIGCTIIDLVLFTIFAYILPSHMFFNIMLGNAYGISADTSGGAILIRSDYDPFNYSNINGDTCPIPVSKDKEKAIEVSRTAGHSETACGR